MKVKRLHPWNAAPAEAVKIQEKLKERVSLDDAFDHIESIQRIAGVDVNYKKDTDKATAAVVVLSFPGLALLDSQVVEGEVSFPYVPGLFSFREIPLLIPALEQLTTLPHLVIVDGQGIAHPQRLGIASHLGILTDIPTIGCAKSRLIGTYNEPAKEKGAHTYLYDKGEIIGAVVRTRTNVSPVYVSGGHKISLQTAVQVVLHCATKFRLPEPLRAAHHMSRSFQRLKFSSPSFKIQL
ncbi:MAG: deoxyribonuclease V [Candidatus Aminicenantes bacterium]|nr:MAG: deoxyribonuclease V [Candidatus Aminicenantes bacterium]